MAKTAKQDKSALRQAKKPAMRTLRIPRHENAVIQEMHRIGPFGMTAIAVLLLAVLVLLPLVSGGLLSANIGGPSYGRTLSVSNVQRSGNQLTFDADYNTFGGAQINKMVIIITKKGNSTTSGMQAIYHTNWYGDTGKTLVLNNNSWKANSDSAANPNGFRVVKVDYTRGSTVSAYKVTWTISLPDPMADKYNLYSYDYLNYRPRNWIGPEVINVPANAAIAAPTVAVVSVDETIAEANRIGLQTPYYAEGGSDDIRDKWRTTNNNYVLWRSAKNDLNTTKWRPAYFVTVQRASANNIPNSYSKIILAPVGEVSMPETNTRWLVNNVLSLDLDTKTEKTFGSDILSLQVDSCLIPEQLITNDTVNSVNATRYAAESARQSLKLYFDKVFCKGPDSDSCRRYSVAAGQRNVAFPE